MSTYEPGTVAVATVRGVPNVRLMSVGAGGEWLSGENAAGWHEHGRRDVTDVRPLVVLDITDPRRVIADLTAAIEATGNGTVSRNLRVLRDQIEAQTKPPKPAEPTGLGAVVEDAKGNRWVRAFSLRLAWTDTLFEEDNREYADIDAVRVLSEGVQP